MRKITQTDNTQIDEAFHGGKHPLHQPEVWSNADTHYGYVRGANLSTSGLV